MKGLQSSVLTEHRLPITDYRLPGKFTHLIQILHILKHLWNNICIFAVHTSYGADMDLTAWEEVCKHAVCGGASLKQCHKTTKGETNYALAA